MKEFTPLLPPERILMGPGPSNCHYRTLRALSLPTIGHLDPVFVQIMEDVQELLRWLFRTANRMTLPVSGTGSAGMEACFANAFERGEKVLIGVNGVFGLRMTQVASKFGQIPVPLEKEWGGVFTPAEIADALKKDNTIAGVALVHAETSTGACQPLEEIGSICAEMGKIFLVDAVTSLGGIPVQIDDWNIDVCYSGTQKCLSCPPGLSPVTFSEKAIQKIAARKTPVESWYFDMLLVMKYWSDERMYHHTAPINMIYSLREALLIMYEEGLESLYTRHKRNSAALLAGLAQLGLEPNVARQYRLPQLNAVKIPKDVDDKSVRPVLLNKYNIEIGAGLGPLAGKIWRIGLMGQSSAQRNVLALLTSLEQIFAANGYCDRSGIAVKAAEEVYEN